MDRADVGEIKWLIYLAVMVILVYIYICFVLTLDALEATRPTMIFAAPRPIPPEEPRDETIHPREMPDG